MNTTRRNTRVAATLLAAVGTALMIISAPALASPERAAPPDPPGNNGTVKIDDTDVDDIPRNHPHVGCTFQVDFYNFDEGVGDATVRFTMIAPTADVGLSVAGDLTPDIGEDPADGTLDASVTYALTFDGEPHPQQGYHVKLTVNAPGSIGNDTKHKVFWVECNLPTTSTSTTETSTTETSTTETSTTETSTTETSTTETTSETTETTSETTGTTVPSSTLPTTSETTETTETTTSETTDTTVPSSTLPTTSASTSPGQSTSPPTSVAPSTSQSPAGPVAPTDFQAGLPGQQPTSATPGGAARSPWAVAGFFGGLAMAASGVTVLVRRPAGDAL